MNCKKILECIKKPKMLLYYMDRLGLIRLDDKEYLKLQYEHKLGKKLDIDNPSTFNEKMQWLKLYDRNPEYSKMVDKYEAKKYAANIIGKEYIIPTLGIYDNFDEIDFEKLPNQFVIKCTHDCGGIVICKDKKSLNIRKAKKKIKKAQNKNYYYINREYIYNDIKPRIIVEEYMEESTQKELRDYKFFCINGIPKMVLVCSNRYKKLKKTYFDIEWNKLDITEGNCDIEKNLKKPIKFEEMKELAKKLAKDIKFLRIDFYEVNGRIYFGEMTFYPQAGYERFHPEEYDKILGDWIRLY